MLKKKNCPEMPTFSPIRKREYSIQRIPSILKKTKANASSIAKFRIPGLARQRKVKFSTRLVDLSINHSRETSNNPHLSLGNQIKSMMPAYALQKNHSLIDLKQRKESNESFAQSYKLFKEKALEKDTMATHLSSLKGAYSCKDIYIKDSFIHKNIFKKNPLLMNSNNELKMYFISKNEKGRKSSSQKVINHLEKCSKLIKDCERGEKNKDKEDESQLIRFKPSKNKSDLEKERKLQALQCFKAMRKEERGIKQIEELIASINHIPHSSEDTSTTNGLSDKGCSEKYLINCINDSYHNCLSSLSPNSQNVESTQSIATSRTLIASTNPSQSLNSPSALFQRNSIQRKGSYLNNALNDLYESVHDSSTRDPHVRNKLIRYFHNKNIRMNLLKSTPNDYIKAISLLNTRINSVKIENTISAMYPKAKQEGVNKRMVAVNRKLKLLEYQLTERLISN